MTEPAPALPILLVRSGGRAALPEWQAVFAEALPGVEIRGWNDPAVDPARVEYVLVWEPTPGRLATYPNLRLIFSTAAGVDHITRDPDLPRHVPIVRMGADEMAQTVGEYVCLGALMILRDLPRIVAAQREIHWERFEPSRTARATRVGIMGMGGIGQVAAGMLQGIGFPVHGWVRTQRAQGGVRCFAGPGELDAFLACTDILVGILPDTPETRGLLNAERLAQLPRGAGLVNAGRGTLIVMPDLLAALDSGHLSLAVLDVFDPEPLPADDPAWRHPRVVVTPHLAGFASRRGRALSVARGIAQFAAGEPITNLYDAGRGY
jgi:glyoxylate/hydroxypyruvate reductase A